MSFIVAQEAYYFIAADGRRGDIIKYQTFQSEIVDPDDYYYFMWVQTMQGYFILRQQFLQGRAQEWHLVGEVVSEERGPDVFERLSELMLERLSSSKSLDAEDES